MLSLRDERMPGGLAFVGGFLNSYLKLASRDAGLANNRLGRAHAKLRMAGHRHSNSRIWQPLLQDQVATPLAHLNKPMSR